MKKLTALLYILFALGIVQFFQIYFKYKYHGVKTRARLPFTPGENRNASSHSQSFSDKPYNTTTKQIEQLVQSLQDKLTAVVDSGIVVRNIDNKCKAMGVDYNFTCNETERLCPQSQLPEDLQSRIEQLVLRDNLQIEEKYREVIKNMSREIYGFYDIIVVSGLSSNHYREAQHIESSSNFGIASILNFCFADLLPPPFQKNGNDVTDFKALIKHVHEEWFPVLKNFTFVLYDLGLTESEASLVRKYCRCQLVHFPFEKFPPHVRTLKCFGFKPAVVRAMIERANIVMWTDTSFRISSAVITVIERARKLGLQQRYLETNYPNPSHTLEERKLCLLFADVYFFGDSPCAHMAFNQVAGGFGIYHNELLTKRAVLNPWLACALKAVCTCPVEQRKVQRCPYPYGTKRIGLCHRNDQSSMTLILAKLFREKYRNYALSMKSYDMSKIGMVFNYFDELENKTTLETS